MAWKLSENLCAPQRGVIDTVPVWEWSTADLRFTVHWACDAWILMCTHFQLAELLLGIEREDENRAKLVALRRVFACLHRSADKMRTEGLRLAELVKETP